jgi:tetratricopeptide (TPR) repeat protein
MGRPVTMKFPKDPKKIKAQIQRYEQALKQERKTFGAIDDGAGKRYLLGPLYLLMGDVPGAVKSFAWFARTFPDDGGEPFQYLCWSLALYRSGKLEAATQKLRQTMLMNLYLLPHLLGIQQEPFNIWHASNWAQASYLQEAPPEFLALWDEAARHWARTQYESSAFTQIRSRYIEIYQQLQTEPVGPKRQQLVKEAFALQAQA